MAAERHQRRRDLGARLFLLLLMTPMSDAVVLASNGAVGNTLAPKVADHALQGSVEQTLASPPGDDFPYGRILANAREHVRRA